MTIPDGEVQDVAVLIQSLPSLSNYGKLKCRSKPCSKNTVITGGASGAVTPKSGDKLVRPYTLQASGRAKVRTTRRNSVHMYGIVLYISVSVTYVSYFTLSRGCILLHNVLERKTF